MTSDGFGYGLSDFHVSIPNLGKNCIQGEENTPIINNWHNTWKHVSQEEKQGKHLSRVADIEFVNMQLDRTFDSHKHVYDIRKAFSFARLSVLIEAHLLNYGYEKRRKNRMEKKYMGGFFFRESF